MTTWETQPMPQRYADVISHNYDAVIVPSQFCFDVLVAHPGVAAMGVHTVPHCFGEDDWPTPPARPPNRPYRFYGIGAVGARKNMLGVLAAYLHAFTDQDPVTLLLVVTGLDRAEVDALVARSGLEPARLPAFAVLRGGDLPEEDLLDLHIGGDCYVSATRGEGWGLGMFEAAIMGRPVVATMMGGHRDFLQHVRWERVAVMMSPCFGDEIRGEITALPDGRMAQSSRVVMPPGVDAKQLWYEPASARLAKAMRAIYDEDTSNQPAHAAMLHQRAELERNYGHRVIGPKLLQVLQQIIERNNHA